MADLSSLVSEDSRQPVERLRRCQLWKIADQAGIAYPPGAAKTMMIPLIEAAGIDVTSPEHGIRWQIINGKDADGAPTTEVYPVIPEHATASKAINYDAEMEARAKPTEEELFQETRLGSLEKRLEAMLSVPQLPFEMMNEEQLQFLAAAAGIETEGKSKEELIFALQGDDSGKNTAERRQ